MPELEKRPSCSYWIPNEINNTVKNTLECSESTRIRQPKSQNSPRSTPQSVPASANSAYKRLAKSTGVFLEAEPPITVEVGRTQHACGIARVFRSVVISTWRLLLLLNGKAGEDGTARIPDRTITYQTQRGAGGGGGNGRIERFSYLVSKRKKIKKEICNGSRYFSPFRLIETRSIFYFHRGGIKANEKPRVSAKFEMSPIVPQPTLLPRLP